MSDTEAPKHFHPFAFHRHPDWHGHCNPPSAVIIAVIHSVRRHDGYPLLCEECVAAAAEMDLGRHRCSRRHFHGPFRHRHTPTGR